MRTGKQLVDLLVGIAKTQAAVARALGAQNDLAWHKLWLLQAESMGREDCSRAVKQGAHTQRAHDVGVESHTQGWLQ